MADIEEQGGPRSAYFLDRNSPMPYYLQVKNELINQIQYGRWKEGELIPGEDELIERFGVSRTVIRQALGEMVHDGFILRKRGKGTFVAAHEGIRNRTFSTLEVLIRLSYEQRMIGRVRVLSQEIVPASDLVAAQLRMDSMTPIIKLVRLWEIKDEITFLLTDYLPYEAFRNVIHVDFTGEFLLDYLQREYGLELENGRCYFSSGAATVYEADLLKTQPGAPVLKLRSIGYAAKAGPVLFSHGLLKSDEHWVEGVLAGMSDMHSSVKA